ncbi:hypothetical protein RI129_001022 [Pyrocoelia pectoralis]|uniref:Terpene synthase n=1 Tax=Pyrocoelia pectoralis TaxID=417401 RepID=A0AAN7VVM2_9COLE
MNGSILVNGITACKRIFNISISKNIFKFHTQLIFQQKPSKEYQLLPSGMNQAETSSDFQALYPTILKDLMGSFTEDYSEVFGRFDYAIRYNILNRNYRLCFPTINAYEKLIPDGKDTKENRMLAHILDWCMELIATGYLLQEDIENQSEKRWSKPCWYRLDQMGKTAPCDTKMMEMSAYMLLNKYFSKFPYYKRILDMFTETYLLTALGQSQDIFMSRNYEKYRNINALTLNAVYSQNYYKTYFFTCRLSVYLGIYVTSRNYSEYFDIIDNLLERMANIQQVQNDALNCFGSNRNYRETGNDIRKGKVTWLIATAQELVNSYQLQLLKEHYGKQDFTSYKIVCKIYNDLDLLEHYKTYKAQQIAKLHRDIEQISAAPLQRLMYQCVTASSSYIT